MQNSSSEYSYRAHKRTLCIVERGIGQLKRRFHVLDGEARLFPQKACQVIIACAVLLNICKDRHISIPDEDLDDEPNDAEDDDANHHDGEQSVATTLGHGTDNSLMWLTFET
jgi:hypothetical protein